MYPPHCEIIILVRMYPVWNRPRRSNVVGQVIVSKDFLFWESVIMVPDGKGDFEDVTKVRILKILF